MKNALISILLSIPISIIMTIPLTIAFLWSIGIEANIYIFSLDSYSIHDSLFLAFMFVIVPVVFLLTFFITLLIVYNRLSKRS